MGPKLRIPNQTRILCSVWRRTYISFDHHYPLSSNRFLFWHGDELNGGVLVNWSQGMIGSLPLVAPLNKSNHPDERCSSAIEEAGNLTADKRHLCIKTNPTSIGYLRISESWFLWNFLCPVQCERRYVIPPPSSPLPHHANHICALLKSLCQGQRDIKTKRKCYTKKYKKKYKYAWVQSLQLKQCFVLYLLKISQNISKILTQKISKISQK